MVENKGKEQDFASLREEKLNEIMEELMAVPEITVLGIGNVVLQDEGFGVRAAEYLDNKYRFPHNVQIIDGGTLGMELLRFVTGTRKLLVIDSINGGAEPGTMFRFANDAVMEHFQAKLSVHEVGIQDVLALLQVTGKSIPDVVVLGAQPYAIEAGVELTADMMALLPETEQMVLTELKRWGVEPELKPEHPASIYTRVAEETKK